jgi:hypothetical protein
LKTRVRITGRAPIASFLAFFAATNLSDAQVSRPQTPTAASSAVVRADEATVFSEMNASGEKASSLKKGESVYVDLRIDQNGRSWCGVRASAQSNRIGFVDCRALERVGNPAPITASRSTGSAAGAPAEIPLARPAIPSNAAYESIKSQVVQEGVIDSGYVATLDQQAETGGGSAVTRAALAHLAAGEFQLSRRETDKALEQFETMERFAGQQRDLLLASLDGRAQALLQKNEYSAALEILEREKKLSPRSANVLALSGWAHYQLNQMDAAIVELQSAQRLHADPKVAQLLERATRDQEAEGDFREGESSHFVLRYHGGASRQLTGQVTQTLEDQFRELQSELHFTPPEPIGVILYTQDVFRDVTRVSGWAGGLNDGRIRIPVQGVDTVSPLLATILKHELTHSFVFQKSAGRAPTWLQEGIAQWVEGRRSNAAAASLVAALQDGKGKPLRSLEGSWMNLTGPQAQFAYAWALAVVESIAADSGSDAIGRLIDATRSEPSCSDALREALRTNYSSLDESAVDYLRRTYLQ